jgi:Small Multidrug Resistance protein
MLMPIRWPLPQRGCARCAFLEFPLLNGACAGLDLPCARLHFRNHLRLEHEAVRGLYPALASSRDRNRLNRRCRISHAGDEDIPVSIAYPIWTGIGALGTVVLGYYCFGEGMSLMKGLSIAKIVGGIIGLRASV